MKKIRWKTTIITIILCLLPMIFGILYYKELPAQIAVHFDANNEPDGFAPKNFALFILPVFMALLQMFICMICEIGIGTKRAKPKLIIIMEWIIPILTVTVYSIMLSYALGKTVDVGRWVCLIIGILFVLLGNYFPKMSYETMQGLIHPKPKDEKAFHRMTRCFGYGFLLFGIYFLIISIIK